MSERRRYVNPPIEEALCEFRFAPGDEWDLTIPGKLHTELECAYPAKPKQQRLAQVALQLDGGWAKGVQHREDVGKLLLSTEDGKRLVGVAPDTLSVHILRPYRCSAAGGAGWEEFRRRVHAALRAYWTVVKPIGVWRISVRYINKIEIPSDTAELGDYLLCAPPEVGGLPDVSGFASRVDYRYGNNMRLALSQGTVRDATGRVANLLDLDVIWESEATPLNMERAMGQTATLRGLAREAFENVITDAARELFGAT